MTDFLILLGKTNLATGAAIIAICLLRRPLRAQFGAAAAYALWLLVPVAGLASLLPPRVAPPPAAHAAILTAVIAPASPQIAPIPTAPTYSTSMHAVIAAQAAVN